MLRFASGDGIHFCESSFPDDRDPLLSVFPPWAHQPALVGQMMSGNRGWLALLAARYIAFRGKQ